MDYTRAVSACFSILGCPGWRDLADRSDQPRIGPGTEMGAVLGVRGPGSVFVLNDVQDEFTRAHMACYGSDPSFNSVTFS